MIFILKYFWIFFVFFIFVYYSHKLTKKKQSIVHTSYTKKLSENLSLLFCVPLIKNCKNNFSKKGNFNTSKLKLKTMADFICHLNQNIPKNPKLIIEEAEKWNFLDAFQSKLNNTIKKDILMFDYHLCAIFDLSFNSTKHNFEYKFFLNQINVKTYLYPSNNINLFYGLELFNFNFDENASYISSIIIKLIEVINLNYKKSCNPKKKKLRKKCFIYYCYQSCFKNKINSYKFLYTRKDDFLIKIDNETSNPVNQDCFNKCFKNFHGYYYYIRKINFENKTMSGINFIFDSKTRKIVPKFLITNQVFFIEISSLLSSFLGFSYLDFLLKCLFKIAVYLKAKKTFLILKIKFFIFVFTIFSSIINCSKLVNDYQNSFSLETSTSLFPITNVPFAFSPCFDVRKIINIKYKNNSIDLVEPIENNNIYSLETYTWKFENLLNKSHVRFINKYKKIIIKKVETFYFSYWTSNNTKLKIYKCFYVKINVNLSLIQNLIERSYMEFEFFKPTSFYFLTAINAYPNSETCKISLETKYYTTETILKGDHSILKCKNYKKKCFSQKECIDKCFVSKYLDIFHKLPSSIPILYKWFKKKSFYQLTFHSYFTENSTSHISLKKLCKNIFPLKSCYDKNYKTFSPLSNKKLYKISLFLHGIIRTNYQVAIMNKHELFSNIITSINIWLGLNIPKLLKKFILDINKKLLLVFRKSLTHRSHLNKTFQLILSLLLFMGLIYNLSVIGNAAIKQSKVTSVRYKVLSEIEYPIITFCLDYEKKIQLIKYSNLSGNLLNKLTFSLNDVFQSITYLDNKLKTQTIIDLDKIEFNRSFDTIQLSHFYILKYKCFILKFDIKIPFYHLYIEKKSNFLVVILKPNITDYYFTLGTKKSFNFNLFTKMTKQNVFIYFFKIIVVYKDLYKSFKDIFYFFRHKNPVNVNEAKSYFSFLKKEFKEQNKLATLMLPLTKKYFSFTINDTEFNKFYRTKMKKLEKENLDNNYSREYFYKIHSQIKNSDKNQLSFRPKLFTSETIIKDKIPLEQFILIVLNIISFWLNLSLINIFDQIKIFFITIWEFFWFLRICLPKIIRKS